MTSTRLALAALIFPAMVASTVSAAETLSLREAVRLAIENNNNYKISIEAVEESRQKVRES